MVLTHEQTLTYNQKVDDEDGHYLVVPEAQLGDRCKLIKTTRILVAF